MAAKKLSGISLTKEEFEALPVMRVGIPDSSKIKEWKTLTIYEKNALQVGYRWWLGTYVQVGEQVEVKYTLITNHKNKGWHLSVFNEIVSNEREYYFDQANQYFQSGLLNTETLAHFLQTIVRNTPFVSFTAKNLQPVNARH